MAKHDYDEDTVKKMEDAKRSLRISTYKRKGYSEKDAVVKGMTSMRLEKKEQDYTSAQAPSHPSEDPYPYGLRLRLENAELTKLGMKELPEVDSKITFTADAVVQGVSANTRSGDTISTKCLELQITDMKVV